MMHVADQPHSRHQQRCSKPSNHQIHGCPANTSPRVLATEYPCTAVVCPCLMRKNLQDAACRQLPVNIAAHCHATNRLSALLYGLVTHCLSAWLSMLLYQLYQIACHHCCPCCCHRQEEDMVVDDFQEIEALAELGIAAGGSCKPAWRFCRCT